MRKRRDTKIGPKAKAKRAKKGRKLKAIQTSKALRRQKSYTRHWRNLPNSQLFLEQLKIG
jgi:hypothetical protein